jgi:hypothetical protein
VRLPKESLSWSDSGLFCWVALSSGLKRQLYGDTEENLPYTSLHWKMMPRIRWPTLARDTRLLVKVNDVDPVINLFSKFAGSLA